MECVSALLTCGRISETPSTTQRQLTFDGAVVLYIKPSCPFCRRVMNYLSDVGIEIEQKDIIEDPDAWKELWEGGGKTQVPCLLYGDTWLYESAEIIKWLEENSEEKPEAS